ncbi:hypothetical protein ONS95_004095 [Cadophora gregata]|uniref:uncharacterized protein n=1 Tax=Cadophora gregata TaxID=51156 RepID=UPI0026DCF610|nr:uncharacterized protein ONS95_004095 [Cadophora gregata]KAK0105562.1 hypothetical protein ONS95_004095 [Cadophora gregata]
MVFVADEKAFGEAFLDAFWTGKMAQIHQGITSGRLTQEHLNEALVPATGNGFEQGYADIVSALFAAGACITQDAIDALHGENMQQDPAVIRLFFNHGLDPNATITGGEPVLGSSILDLSCAREFLTRGTDPNAFGPSKTTALYRALDVDEVELAELLVTDGATLQPDLLWATVGLRKRNGELTTKFLLDKGLDPNQAVSEKWGHPLHLAALAAEPNIIKLLLDGGADRTIPSTGWRFPGKTAE